MNNLDKYISSSFKSLNLQKFCNENIIYYYWRTPKENQDAAYLIEKKQELNEEIKRWETYLKEVVTFFYLKH